MTRKQDKERQVVMTAAYSDHQKGLNSFAFFKVSDREIGEALVQDTFLKTWSHLVKGGNIVTMKAFLYHVLNHLIVDEYRRRKFKPISLEDLLENGFEPSNNDTERLIDVLDGKSAVLLIDSLPENYQKVMHMRYVELLSLKEISLITGQSVNSIYVITHRGLKKLKLLYNPQKKSTFIKDPKITY